MSYHKTLFGWLTVVAVLFLAYGEPAHAFPEKQVTLTVGYGPGGPSDIAARFMQRYFKKVIGKDLIIKNKPGAGGAVAWSQMNQDPADGYYLTLLNFPHTVLQPIARGKTAGYTYEDVTPVLYYTSVPQVLAVPKNSPFNTVEDFVKAARAKPGQITVAGTGVGGSNHSAFYKFNKVAGIKTTYVPFKDTSSTIAALKAGTTDAAWTFTTQGVRDGDSIKMLGMASDSGLPIFPKLKTMNQLGYKMVDAAWWAIGVPKATPKEIRKKVAEIFLKVMQHPDMKKDMFKGGYIPMIVEYSKADEFKQALYDDYAPVGKALVKKK